MNNIMNTLKDHPKGRKAILIAGAAVALLALAAMLSWGGSEETYTEAVAVRENIVTYYTYTGNIESDNTQNVISTNSLTVKKFHVEEGDVVKAGDLLLELDNNSLEANITQARASVEIAQVSYEKAVGSGKTSGALQTENNLQSARQSFETAQNNLNRMQELHQMGAISAVELEQAQTAYDTAQRSLNTAENDSNLLNTNQGYDSRSALASLEQAKAYLSNLEQQLADTRIYADVDGTVSEIYVKENEQVIMGSKILDIIDYDHLKVEIKVDEYGLPSLALGKEVEAYINAFNMEISGHVAKISESASVVNSVSYFPTDIALEADDSLRVGMSVEIKIVNSEALNAVTVPVKAIQLDTYNSAYVTVKDGSKTEDRPVVVGVSNGVAVEIVDGLEAGERVVIPAENSSFDNNFFDGQM